MATGDAKNSQAETRRSLIEAAGAVFAEAGFRNTTVREICQRAGANIAAVNYHFGDKEKLYTEVWRYSHRCALEKYPPDLGAEKNASPAELLRAYIHSFLLRIFDKGRHAWFGKLISREMIEPTGALDLLVAEEIKPQMKHLAEIVRAILGQKASPETIELCAVSVVSQIVFYHHCQPAICRLMPHRKFEGEEIHELAEHISQFSLAALEQIKNRANQEKSRRAPVKKPNTKFKLGN